MILAASASRASSSPPIGNNLLASFVRAAERLADVAESLLTSLALPAERQDLREAISSYRTTTA